MLRPLIMGILVSFGAIVTVSDAEAASAYCARYVGGKERATAGAHANCDFATLDECRASVRKRGGGHCYKANMK